jgi:hypothetical protein
MNIIITIINIIIIMKTYIENILYWRYIYIYIFIHHLNNKNYHIVVKCLCSFCL